MSGLLTYLYTHLHVYLMLSTEDIHRLCVYTEFVFIPINTIDDIKTTVDFVLLFNLIQCCNQQSICSIWSANGAIVYALLACC